MYIYMCIICVYIYIYSACGRLAASLVSRRRGGKSAMVFEPPQVPQCIVYSMQYGYIACNV